jgi:dihydrofolate reductase
MNDFELIVAMDIDGCIGKNNSIPWYLPEDLKHFKEITENSIVIMGRKTFESLPYGPLKNRLNIVISSRLDHIYNYSNVIVTDIVDVFNIIQKYRKKYAKVFIIGGSQIYKLFIKYCNKLHITYINISIKHDINDASIANELITFDKSLLDNFTITHTTEMLTSKNKISYVFCTYERQY